MSDQTTTLKISADASGVEAGVATAKRSLADLDRATAGVASSVKRSTSDTQKAIVAMTSSFGTGDFFEKLGASKGADGAALKPLIDNLRQVRSELDSLVAAEKASAATTLFESQHQAAKKLVQDSAYVRMWTDALEEKEAAERKAASQSSFIASLKSQSDAIGKSRADLLEMQAAQMGVTTQAAPFIAKLRESELAMRGGSKEMNAYGMSARATSAALRGVPAQFTDIVTSLQGGQAPLTVFLQQGGQLKDMFGGAGNAAKALGGYVVGLVNPFTVAAAAAAAVGFAAYKGAQEIKEFDNALALSGNASGVTTDQMRALALSTQSTADALTQFARAGVTGTEGLQKFSESAVRFEKYTGIAVKDSVAAWKSLGDEPVKASFKLNEEVNFLTLSLYRQIKALEEHGKKTEAVALAQDAFASAQNRISDGAESKLYSLAAGWNVVAKSIGGAWKALKDYTNGDTNAQSVLDSQAKIAAASKGRELAESRGETSRVAQYQQILDSETKRLFVLQSGQSLEAGVSKEKAEQVKQLAAQRLLDNEHLKYLSKAKQQERELAAVREAAKGANARLQGVVDYGGAGAENARKTLAANAKALAETEAGIRKKFAETKVKETNPFAEEQGKAYAKYIEDFNKAAIDAQIKTDGLTKSQGSLVKMLMDPVFESMPGTWKEVGLQAAYAAIAVEQNASATEAAAKAQADYMAAIGNAGAKEVASLQQRVEKQAQHKAEIGKTAEQIEAIRRMAETAATQELEGQEKAIAALLQKEEGLLDYAETQSVVSADAKAIYEIELKSLREQISLRKKLAQGYGEGEQKEAQKNAEKEITAERKRGWEETDRLARDVFTSWAEGGSNAAQKIGDTLKKALLSAIYEATLKPLVMQVYTSIAGGGGAGAAVQAASGAGNALSGGSNLLSGLSSLTGAFGSAASANFGATVSSFGSTIGLSIEGGLAAIAQGTGASIASGLGSIAGALGPVALGIGAALALKDAMAYKVEARGSGLTATIGGASGLPSGSVGMYNEFKQTGGLFGGGETINRDWSVADQGVADYISKSVQAITASNKAYAAALGLTSGSIDSFTKNIEVNINGLDAAGQQAAINAELQKFAAEQSAAAFGSATAAFAKEGETSAQTLQRLGSDLTSANAMFKSLGYALFDMSVTGAAAASKLIAAFGNVSEAASQIGSFQQNYFTQAERDSSTLANAQASLQAAGLSYSIEQLVAATAGDIKAAVAQLAANAGGSDQAAAQYAAAVRAANAIAGIKTATPNTPNTPASNTQLGGGFEMYSAEWYANGGAGGSSSGAGGGSSDSGAAAVDPNIEAARSLQEQLDQLSMSAVDLQKRQLAAQRELLNESNKLLFDAVQAAQLAKTNREYQDRIDVLTGNTTDRALSLQRELAAATDASTQSLIKMVYALEDTQTAAKEAYSKAQSGADSAYSALERSVSAQKSVAQEAVNNAKAVIDSVGSAVKGLFSQVDSVVQSEAAKGLSFIDNALASAQSTGYLPDPKDLSNAIGQATGGIDKTQFTSQADADFARLVLAGKLNALGDLAEPQLTAAEQQVEYLDGVLETARNQIDTLRGIDNSVKSVEEAIKLLTGAVSAERAAKAASVIPKGGTIPINPIGTSYVGMGSDIKTIQDLYSVNLGREGDAGGMAYWSERFLGDGVIDDAERQQFAIAAMDEYRAKSRIGLAVGTNYVPYDGFKATLHEGEAVVPKAYNPAAGGSANGTGSTARMEALLTQLIERVAALEGPMAVTAEATGNHRDMFGQVTEGGNAMRGEIMNKVTTVAAA